MPKKKNKGKRNNSNNSKRSNKNTPSKYDHNNTHNNNSNNHNNNKNNNNLKSLSSRNRSILYVIIGFLVILCFSLFFIYLQQIRQLFGIHTKVDPQLRRGYRTRLRRIYERHNPEKLLEDGFIDETLDKWQGREKELFKLLHKKYIKNNKKVRPPTSKQRKRKHRHKDDDDEYDDDDDDEYEDDDDEDGRSRKSSRSRRRSSGGMNNPRETEEEAGIRRRREKDKDRQKRREQRRKDRDGKDFYSEWGDDGLSPEQKKKYAQYFGADEGRQEGDDESDMKFGNDYAFYEGEIELFDD